jgi:Phospholipase_D-nuclease N-terminal
MYVVRLVMILLPLALAIYAVIDCIQTDDGEVRNLPKFVWILVILLFWIVGPIAWLLAGRPPRERRGRTGPWLGTGTAPHPGYERRRPVAPDDDPEFLAQLGQSNAEDEQMLKRWEEELRRREEDQRKRGDGDKTDPDDRGA